MFTSSSPLISIVTPTYNRAQLLVRTIESILHQSYSNWEYIIVDDGSTDHTAEIVKQFLSDSRIKYVKRSNAGAAAARNFGVSMASGDMVTFLDSDDEAFSNWLHTAARLYDSTKGVICVGAMRKFEGGNSNKEKPFTVNLNGSAVKAKLTCGSFFFKKELFEAVGGYDLRISSGFQTEMGLRVMIKAQELGYTFAHSDECPVIIHVHNGERMRNDWQTLVKDHALFVEKIHDFYLKNDKRELSNNYAVLAYYSYRSGNKSKAFRSILKAIQYHPLTVTNYVRAVKYSLS